MIEMNANEMQQVSGGGGLTGGVVGSATPLGGKGGISGDTTLEVGGDFAMPLGGRGGISGDTTLGRKPGVGFGV